MNKEDAMEVTEDLLKLRNMEEEDSAEIVKTYHSTILQKLSECVKVIKEITKLSPATLPVTQTAFIIAERDFMDDIDLLGNNGAPKIMAIFGSPKNVTKLIEQIWDKCPQAFEKVCEKKGYYKK